MNAIIGTTTTYLGTEHAYLNGYKVRIVSVIKNGASPDFNPDAFCESLTDDVAIKNAGGIGKFDRVEVQPYLPAKGSYSFAMSDARAMDLACFIND